MENNLDNKKLKSLFESQEYRDALENASKASELTDFSIMKRSKSLYPNIRKTTSIGVECLDGLTNTTNRALFPSGVSFFTVMNDDNLKSFAFETLTNAGMDEQSALAIINDEEKSQELITQIEQTAVKLFESTGLRDIAKKCVKLLLCTGNIAIYEHEDKLRILTLDDFAFERSCYGDITKLQVRETFKGVDEFLRYYDISLLEASKKLDDLKRKAEESIKDNQSTKDKTDITVITEICYKDSTFDIYKYINNVCVSEFKNKPISENKYSVFSIQVPNGRMYGLSPVIFYLEDFEQNALFSSTFYPACDRLLHKVNLVKPGSLTDIKKLNNAPSGSYVVGNADDVTVVQSPDLQHLQTLWDVKIKLEDTLKSRFTVFESSQIRASERTTAQEVRSVTQAIEGKQSGLYGEFANTIQKYFANYIIRKSGYNFDFKIMTGEDAIERSSISTRINEFMMSLQPLNAVPEQLISYINAPVMMRMIARGLGIDSAMIKSSEQYTQEQQQAQQQQMQAQQQAQEFELAKQAMSNPDGVARMGTMMGAPQAQQALQNQDMQQMMQ